MLRRRPANLIAARGIFLIAAWRMFANKSNADFKQRDGVARRSRRFHIAHQRPNSVLIFDMIEYTQLPRHGNSHVKQATFFDWTFQRETGAEWSDVNETRDFSPLYADRLATAYANR